MYRVSTVSDKQGLLSSREFASFVRTSKGEDDWLSPSFGAPLSVSDADLPALFLQAKHKIENIENDYVGGGKDAHVHRFDAFCDATVPLFAEHEPIHLADAFNAMYITHYLWVSKSAVDGWYVGLRARFGNCPSGYCDCFDGDVLVAQTPQELMDMAWLGRRDDDTAKTLLGLLQGA